MNFGRRGKTVLLLMVIGSLVLSGLGPGLVTTASASHTCDFSDSLVLSLSDTFFGSESGDYSCELWHDEYEDIEEADAEQEKIDIYAGALNERDNSKNLRRTHIRALGDAKGYAWAQGVEAVAQAREGGDPLIEAEIEGFNAIKDYYSRRQIEILKAWNITVARFHYLRSVLRNESGIGQSYFISPGEDGDPIGTNRMWAVNESSTDPVGELKPVNVTLVNGSTAQTLALHIMREPSNACDWTPAGEAGCWNYYGRDTIVLNTYQYNGIDVKPPTDDYKQKQWINFQSWNDSFEKPQTVAHNLEDDIKTFANNSYGAIDNGTLSVDDLETYAASVSDISGNTASTAPKALSTFSALGYEGVPLSEYGYMNVSYNGETYEGWTYYEPSQAPENLTAGESYNGSDDGEVVLITKSGETIPLKKSQGGYTVESIYNESGQNVSTAEIRPFNEPTTNTSRLVDITDDLQTQREEAEEYKQAAAASNILKNFGENPLQGAITLAILGLAFYYVANAVLPDE